MNNKLRQPVSVSLIPQESDILEKLNAKGIRAIHVFRRGLEEYEKELNETLDNS